MSLSVDETLPPGEVPVGSNRRSSYENITLVKTDLYSLLDADDSSSDGGAASSDDDDARPPATRKHRNDDTDDDDSDDSDDDDEDEDDDDSDVYHFGVVDTASLGRTTTAATTTTITTHPPTTTTTAAASASASTSVPGIGATAAAPPSPRARCSLLNSSGMLGAVSGCTTVSGSGTPPRLRTSGSGAGGGGGGGGMAPPDSASCARVLTLRSLGDMSGGGSGGGTVIMGGDGEVEPACSGIAVTEAPQRKNSKSQGLPLRTDFGNYVMGKPLGRGASATVFRAIDTRGQVVAVKKFKKLYVESNQADIQHEVDLMKTLDHPNIIHVIGMCQLDRHVYLFLEYAENGTLLNFVEEFRKLPENIAAIFIKQVVLALKYLHEMGVVHRDIKASNCLVQHGTVKVADFGISRALQDQKDNLAAAGSPYWMAPEVIQGSSTAASDIWSLGITTIELLEGVPPFHEYNNMQALFKIIQSDIPVPSSASGELQDFLSKCLQKDPADRPCASALLAHSWLTKGDVISNQIATPPEVQKPPALPCVAEEQKRLTEGHTSPMAIPSAPIEIDPEAAEILARLVNPTIRPRRRHKSSKASTGDSSTKTKEPTDIAEVMRGMGSAASTALLSMTHPRAPSSEVPTASHVHSDHRHSHSEQHGSQSPRSSDRHAYHSSESPRGNEHHTRQHRSSSNVSLSPREPTTHSHEEHSTPQHSHSHHKSSHHETHKETTPRSHSRTPPIAQESQSPRNQPDVVGADEIFSAAKSDGLVGRINTHMTQGIKATPESDTHLNTTESPASQSLKSENASSVATLTSLVTMESALANEEEKYTTSEIVLPETGQTINHANEMSILRARLDQMRMEPDRLLRMSFVSIKPHLVYTLEPTCLPPVPVGRVWCLAVVDGIIWIGGNGGVISLWNSQTFENVSDIRIHKTRIYAMLAVKDKVFVSSEESAVWIVNSKSLKRKKVVVHDAEHNMVRCLAVNDTVKRGKKTIWSCAPSNTTTQVSIISENGKVKGRFSVRQVINSISILGSNVWLGCYDLVRIVAASAPLPPDFASPSKNSPPSNSSHDLRVAVAEVHLSTNWRVTSMLPVGDYMLVASGMTVFVMNSDGKEIFKLAHQHEVTRLCLFQNLVLSSDFGGNIACWDPANNFSKIHEFRFPESAPPSSPRTGSTALAAASFALSVLGRTHSGNTLTSASGVKTLLAFSWNDIPAFWAGNTDNVMCVWRQPKKILKLF
ncbi:Cytokinesis protein sepH [Pelomyxa schiedti]|nr:Cytokinesis protein sepH [Pelomyxa schiedti]